MNLYLLTQTDNRGYDTYDGLVVAAEDEQQAKLITPEYGDFGYRAWADSPQSVTVKYLGEAKEDTQQGVILASFNAG